jgi:hypothetical protein
VACGGGVVEWPLEVTECGVGNWHWGGRCWLALRSGVVAWCWVVVLGDALGLVL